jgi:hypothetical protein
VQQVVKSPYPIVVEFKDRLEIFTAGGKSSATDEAPSLYHGHGTFQFIPEPEYTWLWVYKTPAENYLTSSRYKSEAEFIKYREYTPEWYQRIEESKRKL